MKKYIAEREDGKLFIISQEEAEEAEHNTGSDWRSWEEFSGDLPEGAIEIKTFNQAKEAFNYDIPADWILENFAENILGENATDEEINDLSKDLDPLFDKWVW
jgi:hypothetical protein